LDHEIMKKYLLIIAILFLTVLVYLPALKAGFMYDDRFFVQDNTKIREWKYAGEYFTNSARSIASIFWDGIWRPLRTITYLTDYKIWGLRPFGFHMTNLLWHLVNIILLYFLLDLLFKDKRLSLMACLLFALHPVQTEAVTWISSRGDLMYVTFGLLMFIFHNGYRAKRRTYFLWLSLLSLALALLSKETAVVFPALIMLYDWLFENKGKIRALLAGWKIYLPYLVLMVLYLMTRKLALGRVSQCPYWGDSFWTTAFTMLRVAVDYVRLLFLPLWLRVDYVYDLSTSLFDWRVWASLTTLGTISFLAWHDIKRSKFLALGWMWLVIGLLPVSNILPLTALLAERFLYLPLVGFAIWAGHLLNGIKTRKVSLIIIIFIALSMSLLSVRRNTEWQDPYKFWQTEVKCSPDSYIAHGNLGNVHYGRGENDAAEKEYRMAVELDPTYDNALSGLAIACASKQNFKEAERYANDCLFQNPNNAGALLTLGICQAAKGDNDSARILFRKSTIAEPQNEKGWINLGIAFTRLGQTDSAISSYQKALALRQDDSRLYNDLAVLLAGNNDLAKAASLWLKALNLDPGYLDARMNLALALERGDPLSAAEQWKIFLQKAKEQGAPVNEQFILRRIAVLNANPPK